MEYWKNKVAVVTGAAHGIGVQIAEDLVKIGMIVIGFEPSLERVDEMLAKVKEWGKVKGQLVPCKCDISKADELKNAFEGIVAAYGGVDVLINNAAIGKEGFICTGNIQDLKDITDTNIFGLITCTRYAIESMVKKNVLGQIININSICGHYMPPFHEPKINMYIASKRTMTILNTLLKNEFKTLNRKIKVTSISPGIVRTGIFKTAGVSFLDDDFFEKNPYLVPKDVANVVLMILAAPRGIQVNEETFEDWTYNRKFHQDMQCWINKVAVITDCDDAVGFAVMEQLVKTGMIVIGFNKSEDVLEKVNTKLKLATNNIYEKVILCICNITNTVQLEATFEKIKDTYEGVDVLINNAHCRMDCLVNDGDPADFKEIIDVNINALIACTRLVAELMIERKTRGHIINMNDLCSYVTPKETRKSVYLASKVAITSVNEILRHEFRYLKANIKVTNIACGSIECLSEPDHSGPKLQLRDIAKLVKLILNTPEHLQVHEVLLDTVVE